VQIFAMYLHISLVSKEVCCTWYRGKKKKSGKGIGMGKINEKDHVVQMVTDDNE
jgi:hypothetical protein